MAKYWPSINFAIVLIIILCRLRETVKGAFFLIIFHNLILIGDLLYYSRFLS